MHTFVRWILVSFSCLLGSHSIKTWLRAIIDTLPWEELTTASTSHKDGSQKQSRTSSKTRSSRRSNSSASASASASATTATEKATVTNMKMDKNEIVMSNREYPHPLHRWLHRLEMLPGELGKFAVREAVNKYESLQSELDLESWTLDADDPDDVAEAMWDVEIFMPCIQLPTTKRPRPNNVVQPPPPVYPIRLGYSVQIAAILEHLCVRLLHLIAGPGRVVKRLLLPSDLIEDICIGHVGSDV